MSASEIMGAVTAPTRGTTRYFSATGCVVEYPDRRDVFVGGSLLGSFTAGDRGMRNVLIVTTARSEGADLNKLARAFGVTKETVRKVRLRFEQGGLTAIVEQRKGGRQRKLTAQLQERLSKMFDDGLTIDEAQKRIRPRVSRPVVGRAHKRWVEAKAQQKEREQQKEEAARKQLSLDEVVVRVSKERRRARAETDSSLQPEDGSQANHASTELGLEQAVMRGGTHVQHLGAWIMIAMINALGLYGYAELLRAETAKNLAAKRKRFVQAAALRVAIDAVAIALALGQRTVEGVRRIGTPSAPTLLRHPAAISATWARRVLGRFVQSEPVAELLHMTQATVLVQQSERHHDDDRRVVFYVDNHLRPYTGKFTIRKGWRMQDKRARPGVSDYWVHDQDGRPVLRVDSPEHEPMVRWLRPIGARLRDALKDDDVRVLMVFDRAGAFATEMAELRDAGFDFVTYERKPYPELPISAFDYWMRIDDERIEFTEAPRKNLGKERGRVRRIALRMPDGEQFNVLAVSDAPAAELISYILARWSRQENQFKHGVERWGINQLDGRQVEAYPPDAIIPNPARRRLERTLRIARAAEGEALRKLQRTPSDDPKHQKLKQDAERARAQQEQLEELRPHVPPRAPVCDTELSGKLVTHTDQYKLLVDTIRIALANAESELAARLAPHLPRPAEAKKTLANLFAAPGVVHVGDRTVTLTLAPAGTASERRAFEQLFDQLNALPLTMSGDPADRRLRFRLQKQ